MRKCEWRGGLPHFVIPCLKRQLRGYLILARQEPGCPGTWAGKAVGLRCLAVNPLSWSNMDFWPAPGGCPTNGASFPSLKRALMLGAGRGLAPSLGFHRQGAFGRGRPAWSSKTRARPRELLHRLSRWPTPRPETAAPRARGAGLWLCLQTSKPR